LKRLLLGLNLSLQIRKKQKKTVMRLKEKCARELYLVAYVPTLVIYVRGTHLSKAESAKEEVDE